MNSRAASAHSGGYPWSVGAGSWFRPTRKLIPSPRENDDLISRGPSASQGFKGVAHDVRRITNDRLGIDPKQGIPAADIQRLMVGKVLIQPLIHPGPGRVKSYPLIMKAIVHGDLTEAM